MRFSSLLFIGIAAAAPLSNLITADQILAISPNAASCANAAFPDECRTAEQAVRPINSAFDKYGITELPAKAALVSLMLFESGGFAYNRNHWPGVPGQGTRNMQSPAFNLLYAQSLFDSATVADAQAKGPDAVLDLVAGDEESFASAAWFVTSQCGPEIQQGLAAGTTEGWETYLTKCVGTTVTDDRNALWTKSLNAIVGA